MNRKILCGAGALTASLFAAIPAWAQEAAAAPVPNPGNNAWMMTSTVLVLLMILPGLALFYGGLTRSKNMLSTMTQVGAAAALAMLIWVIYGYSTAFGPEGNAFFSWGNLFLANTTPDSTAATFSDEVISEYVFICFQMTFAAITAALVLGATVERMKFSAVMVFTAIWLTIVYFPIAHMVWAGGGLLFEMGALDFAGGTVVHINAGVSALVAALILGKRKGYPTEPMPPHSLTLTMVGTGLLWVGWFGFNAGSELEADGTAGLAMINTFVATASAGLFWMLAEKFSGHKGSALGFCSGIIAGLVAVTPAAGNSGPFGAIILGAVASIVCFILVSKVKPALGYDDSLDAFGIHGVGGIIGAIGTGIVYQPGFGGPGDGSVAMGAQVWIQIQAVVISLVWAAVGTAIAIFIAKLVTGLRVSEEVEHEGLDIGEHGERAYN
ncbi:MAG: ammonia channel protein [Novosphingobium sp.]|uniref:Ammonium transporter n=1 Tax=Novosphingobium indicum TaxID=462949 RepID=A0ABQ2JBQ9_9SPHN|nr:ammonium transporter [Novosphingobium indicum]MAC59409.1 ammonia channel protein [Novosphingobium sp.]GGN43647.1 ammonium transporter [Novosphingobium indicum]|tara:strand:+ start:1605 stop:2921 length:1317 start_codon:yes stop_codon:yes gene_type:complete